VPGHSRSSEGEESPIRLNVDCYRPPYRDGRVVRCAPGGSVFHCGIRAWRSPTEAFQVDIVDALVAMFQK
jgi:hypothetical protein